MHNVWGHLDCDMCVCVLCIESVAFLPFWVLLLELIRGYLDATVSRKLCLSWKHIVFLTFSS